jgi:murein DD-endopeptidase MepM/ murein hydrolase activator NlpD
MRRWIALLISTYLIVPQAIWAQENDELEDGPVEETAQPSQVPAQESSDDFELTLAKLGAARRTVRAGDRVLQAGQRPEDFFQVGDFRSFGLQNLTLEQIEQITGEPIGERPIGDYPLLYNYVQRQYPEYSRHSLFNKGFAIIMPWRFAQTTPPPSAVVPINQIPGLGNVTLTVIPGANNAPVSAIPGLPNIPIFQLLSFKDFLVRFDIPFGRSSCDPMGGDCEEHNIDNTASGNWKNRSISCLSSKQNSNQPCGYIDVRRNLIGNENKIRWVGKWHEVPGGNGYLCTKEPTGRFPFGENPKYVVEEVKEEPGKVEFALYFSVDGPYGAKSAHCFGPFPAPPPFDSAKEGEWILFGPDEGRPPANVQQALQGMIAGIGPGAGACSPQQGQQQNGSQQFQQANQNDLVPVTSVPGRTEYLHRDAAASFEQMVQAAKQRGVDLYALSGYRSINAQQQLLANNPSSQQIAQPGQSEHHTGYAVDISNGNPKDDAAASFEQSAAYQWLKANASKYGFVQSYKAGSQYGNEPWHWRWQGNATAQQLFNGSSTGTSAASQTGDCGNLPAPVSCEGSSSTFVRPSQGTITDRYGWSPWRGRVHEGIDIAAAIGTPIVSANCGVVTYNNWYGGYGNSLRIKHPGGGETWYAHLNSPGYYAVGQQVKRGQVIGELGTTGNSTGPHLHFEWHPRGWRDPVDPEVLGVF